MSGEVLLDTNIVIALFAKDSAVEMALSQSVNVFVPSIVLGELRYGASKSVQVLANMARIDQFTLAVKVLPVDEVTAEHYGRIKSALQAKGRPLPENDIWIAAIAQQRQLMLISRDAHFSEIDNLSVTRW